jgi:hypothetical protein
MGNGQHKIKRKAEQAACMEAINFIKQHNDFGIDTTILKETDDNYVDDSE